MRVTGVVKSIEPFTHGVQLLNVETAGASCLALNYVMLTGEAQTGDIAVLNTMAVEMGFGTGGYDFVVCLFSPDFSSSFPMPRTPSDESRHTDGMLVRLRYTPLQIALPAAEESFPEAVQGDLEGTPVIACGLHSQIVPVLAGIRMFKPDLRAVYVMTDSAALYLGFSLLYHQLRTMDWLQAAVTVGQAFGGDLEAVNVYSGMLLAKNRLNADVILVGQGPGNTGTGSPWGFSGIDQGIALNAAGILHGKPIAALRVSFADSRPRHRGVSHHSLTVLSQIALVPSVVPVPQLSQVEDEVVQKQLEEAGVAQRHILQRVDADHAFDFLMEHASFVRTMGRTPEQDKAYFLAGSAAGIASL